MKISHLSIRFGMLSSNNVWAVYGVVLHQERACTDCDSIPKPYFRTTNQTLSSFTTPSTTTEQFSPTPSSSSQDLSAFTSITASDSIDSAPYHSLSTTLSPPAPTAKPTQGLSTGAKIGIGVTIGVLVCALALLGLFEACYWRRKRREKAMQRAVQEVESSMHKGSQERIVLESRVSIVFEDDGSMADDEEEEGEEGDEGEDEDEDEGEQERGRHGFSLPRRGY